MQHRGVSVESGKSGFGLANAFTNCMRISIIPQLVTKNVTCFGADRAKLAPSLMKRLIGDGDSRNQSNTQQQGVELAVPGQKPSEPAADKPKTPSADAPLRWLALAVFGVITIFIMIVLLILIAI